MEKKNFNYSLKNIPVPNKQGYLKSMIDKVEHFLKKMRWKAYFYEKGNSKITDNGHFGFKSENTPPQIDALIPFENDIYELVRSIEFKTDLNDFQKQLKHDVKEIRSSDSLFVPADKTTNIYKVAKDTYQKLLKENITTTYKKAEPSVKNDINMEAKQITKKLKINNRIDCMAEKDAFISIKDHKENFPNKVKCRLINPAKTEVGKISKHHLEKINNSIRTKTHMNQWQNTATVIDWFNKITNKVRNRFLQFDIIEF